MFTLNEVIFISFTVSVIVGYISYQFAELKMIARILDSMSDVELARLERLTDELDANVDNIGRPSGIVTLTQEVVNDNVYLYDSAGNFICQGSTWEEVASRYGEIDKREALVECATGGKYSIVAGKIKN